MRFDLTMVPFSGYGSAMAVSRVEPPGRRAGALYVRTVGALSVRPEVFKLEALRGRRVAGCREVATPAKVAIKTSDGAVELCNPEPNVLRIRGRNAGLRLTYATPGGFNTGLALDKAHFVVNSHTHLRKYMLTPLSGHMEPRAPVGHAWRQKKDCFIPGARLPPNASRQHGLQNLAQRRDIIVGQPLTQLNHRR